MPAMHLGLVIARPWWTPPATPLSRSGHTTRVCSMLAAHLWCVVCVYVCMCTCVCARAHVCRGQTGLTGASWSLMLCRNCCVSDENAEWASLCIQGGGHQLSPLSGSKETEWRGGGRNMLSHTDTQAQTQREREVERERGRERDTHTHTHTHTHRHTGRQTYSWPLTVVWFRSRCPIHTPQTKRRLQTARWVLQPSVLRAAVLCMP